MKKSKRLTCPLCKDSGLFSFEDIRAAGGRIFCGNHRADIEMLDLAEVLEIWGFGSTALEPEEVDFYKEDMFTLHPDDYELVFEEER